MYRLVFLTGVSCCIVITGCKDQGRSNLLAELASSDSVTVMYYHEPGKPRFFTLAKLYDKTIITAIGENVNGKVVSGKGSCVTQGKIYGYGKGDAVTVVYFTRQPECRTMSFIKTGEKYFVRMSDDTKKILDELEKTAKEPPVQN